MVDRLRVEAWRRLRLPLDDIEPEQEELFA
jgi:hypothetical protein